MLLRKKLLCFPLAAILLGSSGCATISGWFGNPTTAQYIQDAVDVAVLVASTQGVSASILNTAAKAALAADNGAAATVADLQALLTKEFAKLNLPAAEQDAVNIFIAAAIAALQAKLGTNSTVQQAQVLIADFLNDVITATSSAQVAKRGLKP